MEKPKLKFFLITLIFLEISIKFCNAECKNGGFDYGNNTCNCPSYWNGPNTQCNTTICLNVGASVSSDGACKCPPGYQGVHCEAVLEFDTPASTFILKPRSFNLFVNLYVTSYYYTGNTFQKFMTSVANISDTYTSYLFYTTAATPLVYNGNDQAQFKANVNANLNNYVRPALYDCVGYPKSTDTGGNLYARLYTMIMNEPNEPLQRTSINVFTQFPADPEDGHGSYELLEQRAIAFGVAINFYFGDEPYLVGCFNSDSKSKDEISRMRELAFVTGGFFIVYQGDTTGNVIPSLLPIQTNPQLYYYDSRPDCSQGLNVSLPLGGNSFQNTNGFRVIVSVSNGSSSQDFDQASLTAKCHIGGLDSISWLASSSEPGVKIFNLTTLFVDPCPIQLAPIHGASCSIQIYHNGHPDNRNSDNSGLQVYTTYTDSPDVDSSYINMAVGAALYSRVHIQSDETESYTNFNVTEISFHSSNGTSSTNGQAYHPHSTFEFVTNNTFTCQLSTLAFPRYWLNVKFTANNYGTPVDVIRTVPVKCYSKNLDPGMSTAVPTNIPSATTTMVEEVTTTKEVPTTQTASTTITTDSCIAQSSNAKPVIVVGWSRQINTAIAKNFVFGLSSSNLTGVYQKYGLLPINQVIGNSFPCSRAVQFYSSSSLFISGLVALVNSINGNSCGTPTTDNFIVLQLLDLVQNHDTDLPQGSILTFLVDDTDLFPDSNLTENIITIQRFATTKRYHINFIVDNSYSSFYSSSTYDFYQTLATLTDGHFIRMDTNQDITQVTMDLFSTYFTNRLVLSRELYTPNYDVYAVLGTVDLTSGDQTLYLTASVNDISSLLWLTYEVTSLKTNKTVANTTGTVTFGLPMSLYYTQLVNETVPGNDIYQITITKLVGHSSVSVFRVWQKVPDPDLFAMNIKYLNSNAANYQPPLDQGPDEKSGVISQLDVFDNSIAPNLNIELEIYDCNGNLITNCLTNEWQECILDGDTQTTRLTNNDKCANSYIFSPFFCKAQPQTCLLNTFNYYNVKYKAVNLYTNATYQIHSRFLCPNVNITTTDCKNGDKKVIDNKCDCSKSDPPFWRGPTCQIQDCSGNGDLIYNGTVFYCNCSHGFNGQSCEQGYCVETNTEAGALDNFYRTLTIGLVFNSNDEFTSVQSYTINTLKAISNPSNIWQYHLFIGCAGFVQSIYLGSSFDNLNSSLNSIDSTILAKCFIQNQTDLTPLVEFGLRPLGREIRGLFWLSSGNSLNIYVDQPDSSSLESFYRTIYGYRQELYITSFFNSNNAINVNNTTGYESTAYATRATGGQRFDIPIDQIVICYSDWLSLIISTPTSINYYLSSNKTETIPGIYVEANAYVFVSGLQSIDVAVTPAMPFICPSSNSNQFTGWINLTTSQSYELTATVSSGPLNLPYAVVVRVPSSAYDISTIFVDKLNEDRPKALPLVNATVSLAINIPSSWKVNVTDADNTHRIANDRGNCTFGTTTTVPVPFDQLGDSFFKLTFQNSTTSVTKFIPYVVSDQIVCKNGGSHIDPLVGRCVCSGNYDGPDCSKPICSNGGSLNTMHTACNCPLGYYGPTCDQSVTQSNAGYIINEADNRHRHTHSEL